MICCSPYHTRFKTGRCADHTDFAMSADAFTTEDVQKCMDAGMNGHIANLLKSVYFSRHWVQC